MWRTLQQLDRRWIFLGIAGAVGFPILAGLRFPEQPSQMAAEVFRTLDELPDGSRVLVAADFDPASGGELLPMLNAFTRHAALKRHKLLFLTLWPQGMPLLQIALDLMKREFPHYQYGRDYVNLGFHPGNEGVIKVLISDLKEQFATDVGGQALRDMPLTRDLKNIQQIDLIVSVSAGTPGSKEWIQYASAPFGIKTVAGSTGVQTPALLPYVPQQLAGVLGAIKAAAEYEQQLTQKYPELAQNDNAQEALRRMGPQLVAHVYVIGVILLGNAVFLWERAGRGRA